MGLEAGVESETPIRFLLAAEDTAEMFKLDLVFFENWYAYQDETVAKGKPVNLIQVMSVCRMVHFMWVLWLTWLG